MTNAFWELVKPIYEQACIAAGRAVSGRGPGSVAIRRFSKDYEYKMRTSETLLDIAATRLIINRLGPA